MSLMSNPDNRSSYDPMTPQQLPGFNPGQNVIMRQHNVTGPNNSMGPYNSMGPNNSMGPYNSMGPNNSMGPYNSMGPNNSMGPYNSMGPNNGMRPNNGMGTNSVRRPNSSIGPYTGELIEHFSCFTQISICLFYVFYDALKRCTRMMYFFGALSVYFWLSFFIFSMSNQITWMNLIFPIWGMSLVSINQFPLKQVWFSIDVAVYPKEQIPLLLWMNEWMNEWTDTSLRYRHWRMCFERLLQAFTRWQQYSMRLDRLHRAYPSLHPFGVVHWVPVLSNIKTATGCESK